MFLVEILCHKFYQKVLINKFLQLKKKFIKIFLYYGLPSQSSLCQAFIDDYVMIPPNNNEEMEVSDIFAIHFETYGIMGAKTPSFDVYLKHDDSFHVHVFAPDIKQRPYVTAKVKINGVELGTFPLLEKVTN